jgi:hypothetical protein
MAEHPYLMPPLDQGSGDRELWRHVSAAVPECLEDLHRPRVFMP